MHHIVRSVFLCLLIVSCQAANAQGKSRLVVVGDLDAFIVGQDGYCGARTDVPSSEWKNIIVRGDERVWFEAKSVDHSLSFTMRCSGDYSFVPQSGKAYIIRYWLDERQCHFELFRVVPQADPVREPLTRSEPQVCLFK